MDFLAQPVDLGLLDIEGWLERKEYQDIQEQEVLPGSMGPPVLQDSRDTEALQAIQVNQESPEQRENWESPDCQDLLPMSVMQALLFKVHLANLDNPVALDPAENKDLQDLPELQAFQEL